MAYFEDFLEEQEEFCRQDEEFLLLGDRLWPGLDGWLAETVGEV